LNLTALENLDADIQYKAALSDFTTFHLGGNCPALLTCRTPQQLEHVVQICIQENLKFILIGGGSNLVVSDEGIDCYVIRYVSETPTIERQGDDLIVSASTLLDDLVKYAVENSLEGLNCASGIPGTVGGAIVGNAGAFGQQVGDVINTVCTLDKMGKEKELSVQNLGFTYRNSILKQTGDIVLSARFSLKPGDQAALQKRRDEILALRREKHPSGPCAGSFFRNIEPTSKAEKRQAAGWFLDQVEAKKLTSGGAKICEKHANIIVKSQDCRAQDVFELSKQMARLVKDKFDLDLVREVRFVGKFKGMPADVKDTIW